MTTDVSGARVPKYYRIKQRLLAMTEALQPGAAVPAERLLAEQFDTLVEGHLQACGEKMPPLPDDLAPAQAK